MTVATTGQRVPGFGDIGEQDKTTERVDKLIRLHGHCDSARRAQEADWFANSTYLRGNQLDDLPSDVRHLLTRRVPLLKKKSKKVQYVANRMLAMDRQAKSFLLDNIGRQIAVPSTQEEEDGLSAELGTDLLSYFADQNDERERREDDIGWTMVAGRVLPKVEWDPDLPGQGPNGLMPGAGDVAVRTLSPLAFHIDPWVTSLKAASFVLEVGIRDIGELKDLFGAEAVKDIKPEGIRDGTYLLDKLLGSVMVTKGNAASAFITAPKREDGIMVLTFNFTPTVKHPKGLVIWLAGKTELHQGELPEGIMPFAELTWLKLSGQHYPLPFHSPLRSPSHYMNVLRSQMLHLANAQLRGDTIRRGGSKVKMDVDPDSRRRDLWVPEDVSDFRMMQYQLDWAAAAKTGDDMWEDTQHIAGIRGPSIGEHVRGVDTAAGQALLREPDVAGMAMVKRGLDKGYAKVGLLQLKVAQNHYKVTRLLRVTGADQKQQVTAFRGSDLAGVADVTTKPMPMMTEAQKRLALSEAHVAGEFGPYLDPDGRFSIQVKRAKLRSLQNRGIPDIEHEVERLAAPMSLEELEQAAGEADMMDFQKNQMLDELQMAQMEGALNPQEAEGAASPEEAMAAQLMGGGEEGQPAQAGQGA